MLLQLVNADFLDVAYELHVADRPSETINGPHETNFGTTPSQCESQPVTSSSNQEFNGTALNQSEGIQLILLAFKVSTRIMGATILSQRISRLTRQGPPMAL
eukprot:4731103-Amphidinium_carterae.1